MIPSPLVCLVAPRSRPGHLSPLVPDIMSALAGLGCRVQQLDPDAGRHHLRGEDHPPADLYIVKSGTEAGLSTAGALHAQGRRLLVPYPVAAACRDKIVQTRVLADAGVPVPDSWLTCDPASMRGELGHGPLIFKDPRGSRGRGLVVVQTEADLQGVVAGRPWLVMRYHRPEGDDLKLYRIGDEVFGVARPFPARSYQEKLGRPFAPGPALRDIVLRCGEAFGIDLYGVDVITHAGRLWVVDMSSFPGFKGVPEAGRRIAERAVQQLPLTSLARA